MKENDDDLAILNDADDDHGPIETEKKLPELDSADMLSPEAVEDDLPVTKTPIDRFEQEEVKPFSTPENFEDVKQFSENISYGGFSAEGNPPFSVIIKDVKFHEDAQEICDYLIELKIIDNDQKDETLKSLTRGQTLIPRLSEYAAIILCHGLRKFDIEIIMGLTEEVNPPKSYESNDRGLSTKYSIYNNKKHDFNFRQSPKTTDVLATTMNNLSDFEIVKYLGVTTETRIIGANELSHSSAIEDEIINQFSTEEQSRINNYRIQRENRIAAQSEVLTDILDTEERSDKKKSSLSQIYQEMIENLKVKAQQKQANAVIGVNFSLNPISVENYLTQGPKYQIICTGNLAWIEKK